MAKKRKLSQLKLKQPKPIKYIPYSEAEQRLFELLPRAEKKKIDTNVLADRYYREKYGTKWKKYIPEHPRVTVTGSIKALQNKAEHNGEPFTIRHTGRKGPYPAYVWIENIK